MTLLESLSASDYVLLATLLLSILRKQARIGWDQLFNAILGGYSDETISARAHRSQGTWYWNVVRVIANTIFCWQEDHCKESYEREMNREYMPEVYRYRGKP